MYKTGLGYIWLSEEGRHLKDTTTTTTTTIIITQQQLANADCTQFDKIDHIISVCPILAKEQYIKRHDSVCAPLHFNICKETGAKFDK